MFDQSKQLWVMVLNQYQRDNLLWLLQLVGGETTSGVNRSGVNRSGIAPFSFANTGDWVKECEDQIGSYLNSYNGQPPIQKINATREQVMQRITMWVQRFDMLALDIALKLDEGIHTLPLAQQKFFES